MHAITPDCNFVGSHQIIERNLIKWRVNLVSQNRLSIRNPKWVNIEASGALFWSWLGRGSAGLMLSFHVNYVSQYERLSCWCVAKVIEKISAVVGVMAILAL